jgi:hypothetical protein
VDSEAEISYQIKSLRYVLRMFCKWEKVVMSNGRISVGPKTLAELEAATGRLPEPGVAVSRCRI